MCPVVSGRNSSKMSHQAPEQRCELVDEQPSSESVFKRRSPMRAHACHRTILGLDVVTADTPLMARVGRCGSPTFSPDGKTLAFVCDMSDTPQVWTAPTEGRWPTLVTALDDPVSSVEWSPSGDWLAISVSPGGGMNGQIYLPTASVRSSRG